MTGDIKSKYGSSGTFAFTSSQSLALSSTLLVGAFSAEYDGTSACNQGLLIGGKIKAEATARATGILALYVWGSNDDSTGVIRPDLGGGTALTGADSTGTWTHAAALAGGARLHTALATDSNAGAYTYPIATFDVATLFGGRMPQRVGLYVASATTGLDTAAAAATFAYTPVLSQYT